MTYYSLCGSVALSNKFNVTCFNYGLGSVEQCGNQKLNIASLDGGGSTLHNINNLNVLKQEYIEIKSLDSICIENISFIKMDVEDNELQVLKSSVNTLQKSKFPKILFEMNTYNSELVDFLQSLNYSIINIKNSNNMYLASI